MNVRSIIFISVAVAFISATIAHGQIAEQPELKDMLDNAPLLEPEAVASPARSVMPWGRQFVLAPDGENYHILQWYIRSYRRSTRVYICDLSTGEVTLQWFPETEGKVRVEAASWTLFTDGKMYGATPDWSKWSDGGGMNIYVYDPAKKEVELFDVIPGLGGERHGMTLGPDGRLYGAGTYIAEGTHNESGAYWLDPRTGEYRVYGPLGPRLDGTAMGYFMGVCETHIYVASGSRPWHLVAVNIESGEQEVLASAYPGSYQHRMWIRTSYPGAWITVQEDDESDMKSYWLWHGEMIPREDPNDPPWEPVEHPLADLPPRPEVYGEQLDPDEDGRATLWVRMPEEGAGWQPIHFDDVETHSLAIHRLTQLPGNRLFGTAQGYQGRFLYDLETGESTPFGRIGGSPYALIEHDGKAWWSGYPSGPVFVFDPDKLWTTSGPPGEAAPPQTSRESNPFTPGSLYDHTRVKKVFSAVAGADGKIYFGGIGQRDYAGGSLGWVDPETYELGGMWRPFSAYRIHWMATARDNRWLIISTRTAPDELRDNVRPDSAKIFFYDVERGELVADIIPVQNAEKAGPVLEVGGDRLVGLTDNPDGGGGLLYGIDTREMVVRFTRPLPRGMQFPWSQGTSQSWDYQLGPDGFVWTYLDNMLVRIDPREAVAHVVGRLERPGRFIFVGNDIYLAGAEELRVLRNIVPDRR